MSAYQFIPDDHVIHRQSTLQDSLEYLAQTKDFNPHGSNVYVIDFETYYEGKKLKDQDRPRYSLSDLTYEEYLRDDRFQIHGVGVSVNGAPSVYHPVDYSQGKFGGLKKVLVKQYGLKPGNEHTVVCHNMFFDGPIMCWEDGMGLFIRTLYCTQAMGAAAFPFKSVSLKNLCVRLFPDDPDMRKGTELATFDSVKQLTADQQKAMGIYCNQDCDLTWALLTRFWQIIPAAEFSAIDWHFQAWCYPALVLDRTRMEKYLAKLIEDQEHHITKTGISGTVYRSKAKFCEKIKELTGEDPPLKISKTTEEEIPALSKNDREWIQFKVRHAEHIDVWRAHEAVNSSIEKSRVKRLLAHAHPESNVIALPLKPFAAHTGRSGGVNKINAQNLPSGRKAHQTAEIRHSLTAPDGYVVFVSDLSNIECRILNWLAGQLHMLSLFQSKGDPYSAFGKDLYDDPNFNRKKEPYLELAHIVKSAVLGLGYGMGWSTYQATLYTGMLGPQVIIDAEEAKRVVNVYRSTHDMVRYLWGDANAAITYMSVSGQTKPFEFGQDGILKAYSNCIQMPNGLYLQYPKLQTRMQDDDTGESGYAYQGRKGMVGTWGGTVIENVCQGLARIVLEERRDVIHKELKSNYGGKSGVLLQVHDENVGLVPEAHADEACARINEIMCDTKLSPWMSHPVLLEAETDYDYCYKH